ncbi:hypothetical protein [Rhabdothermincola salaria]|uniref:hypothetical protein n=1 Tax=Rhabdothermincola salaria TaxID=2903142 RepID=UPI001E4A17DC|nr:hypothetical protein [Rhabdothermincola salaria]MCD9624333.1 hypothetical protein [Rhabdothermincola salaria]
MNSPDPTRAAPRRRSRFAALAAAMALLAGVSGVMLAADPGPVEAAEVSFSQCNDRGAGPDGAPLTVTCSVSIVNTVDATGATSTVVYERICTLNECTGDIVSPSDVVTAVNQCNGSNNVGGSVTVCSVDIVNNISLDAPGVATPLTLEQCIGSGGGGGTDMTACIPSSDASPAVTQCNGSGTGGGGFMVCTASGTVSSVLPVTVNQCNGSENGGGSTVTCTTSMTTNLVDTSATTTSSASTTPTTADTTPTTATTAPDGSGVTGSPTGSGPGGPGGPGSPGAPGTPGGPVPPVAPPVASPPRLTG